MLTQRFNIAIALPEDFQKESIQKSTECSRLFETDFTLDGINFIPHITIYSPEFPEENLEIILEKVSEVTKNSDSFTLNFKEIILEEDFVMLDFNENSTLSKLHSDIVKELNPLRGNALRS